MPCPCWFHEWISLKGKHCPSGFWVNWVACDVDWDHCVNLCGFIWALGLHMDEFGRERFDGQWQHRLQYSSLSLPFPLSPCLSCLLLFSSHLHPWCVCSFIFPSTLCVSLINTSLCLPAGFSQFRQAFLSTELVEVQSCLPFFHPSVRLSQGFVLFSTAINLLANRQQSCRLGVGIRFLALHPPKNAGA